jgi:putative ABC transport system ATP-binding protein
MFLLNGATMKEDLIQVQELTKSYGAGEAEVLALHGVNVTIGRGEYIAIMGPSGSGKSTLMNILGCLDRPTSGSYLLDGQDVSRLSKNELATIRNQKIGFIFQSFNLLPRMSAFDNVMMPLLYNREDRSSETEKRQQVSKALEAVGLEDRMHHHPNELSGGQQQRVAIARALINRPTLILADEPTGNLDSHSSEDILSLLRELHAQGTTIVLVTHDQGVATHAQRVIIVKDGQVVDDQGQREKHTRSQANEIGMPQAAGSIPSGEKR